MRLRRLAIASVALVTTAATLVSDAGPALGGQRYRITSRRIAPGLIYTRILDRKVPNRIKVLKINPSRALTIDPVLAATQLPGRRRTSAMSRRAGAVAGVNGTFGLPSGRPIGVFQEDGELKTTPLVWGRAFSMSFDELHTFIGHPRVRIKLVRASTGRSQSVQAWNESGFPSGGLAAYSPVGGTVARPPHRSCSARLYPIGDLEWDEKGAGLEQDHLVNRVQCGWERLSRAGGVVVSARRRTVESEFLSSLVRGESVRLSWSVGWPFVLDAIAGNPTLIEDGRMVAYSCTDPFCKRNPRTGVGVTRRGHILLVTVDGRQRRSRGASLIEFARIFRMLGSSWALNLDGGGSTTMVVKGEVVNRPSDNSGERYVSSALLVLPSADGAEPHPVFPSTARALPAPVAPDEPPATARLDTVPPGSDPSLTDAGSTGGLLDALSQGVIGPEVDLPQRLERIASEFRAAESSER